MIQSRPTCRIQTVAGNAHDHMKIEFGAYKWRRLASGLIAAAVALTSYKGAIAVDDAPPAVRRRTAASETREMSKK